MAGLFGCILLLRELNTQFLIHQQLVGHMSRSLDLVVNPRLSAISSNFFNGTNIYNTDKTANWVKFDKDIYSNACLISMKKSVHISFI